MSNRQNYSQTPQWGNSQATKDLMSLYGAWTRSTTVEAKERIKNQINQLATKYPEAVRDFDQRDDGFDQLRLDHVNGKIPKEYSLQDPDDDFAKVACDGPGCSISGGKRLRRRSKQRRSKQRRSTQRRSTQRRSKKSRILK